MDEKAEIDETPISLLLLEDLASSRQLYATWLREEGFLVKDVGSLAALQEELGSGVVYDVALVDVALSGPDDIDGFAAVSQIKAAAPETLVAIFTTYGEGALKEHLPRLFDYSDKDGPHLDGVLLKSMPIEALAAGIRELHACGEFVAQDARKWTRRSTGGPPVTARQRAAVQLLAQGFTHRQIERELHISPKTVQRDIQAAKRSLVGDMGATDAQLVAAAHRARVIEHL